MKPRSLSAYDPRDYPVLYVDDEAANLRIFELTFRKEFKLLTAQSAEEGMELINENRVAVVLSDHKMPGMTGVEFLTRVREIDEHAIRILVTAYGDTETLGSAINDGRIYRYIPKPWLPEEMALTLRMAIERHVLDRERSALLDELTLLNWLSRRLHRELDPDRVVRLLIDAAHNELGFDGAAVLFFTPDRSALRWASIAPQDELAERLQQISLTRATAPHFFDALDGGSLQVLGVDHLAEVEAPIRDWIAEVSADEMVIVPLAGQSGVLGAVAIDNRSGGRRFGGDHRTLLDGLSTQAVIALENARTVAALRSSRSQLQQADRLGLFGRIALGMATDLANPLEAARDFVGGLPEPRAAKARATWQEEHARVGATLDLAASRVEMLQRLSVLPDATGASAAVDLGSVARDVVSLLDCEAGLARVAIELDVESELPKVQGDAAAMQQLLLGLAMNAIEWTPAEGRISIRILREGEGDDELVLVEVADEGPGMTAEQVSRVFEAGDQGASAAGGIGMMIAHQIVREHAGSIAVQSAPGEGSTFRVRLPADGSPDA